MAQRLLDKWKSLVAEECQRHRKRKQDGQTANRTGIPSGPVRPTAGARKPP